MKLQPITALAIIAMASVVFAQSSASATSSAPAATHTVKVGWPIGQHAFDPEETKANLGDKISK
jgi:plastocyanin